MSSVTADEAVRRIRAALMEAGRPDLALSVETDTNGRPGFWGDFTEADVETLWRAVSISGVAHRCYVCWMAGDRRKCPQCPESCDS